MPDDRNVDWGRLPETDLVGDYEDAFRRGRRLSSQIADGQPSALSAVLAGHIGELSPSQRQAVIQRIEALSQVMVGLRGATADPVERLRMAHHLAQMTPGIGLEPASIGPHDVTDPGLMGHLTRLAALGRHIAGQSDPSPSPAPSRYIGPLRQANSSIQGGVRYIGPAR